MNTTPGLLSSDQLDWLLRPTRLFSWADLAHDQVSPPMQPGVYGWFFSGLPSVVPVHDCVRMGDRTLAYVGISPGEPPANGKPPSKQRLRHRVRYHFRGNAEGSTLRLTLGALLAANLELQLRRVGSGKRMTFAAGEARLTAWLEAHARVVWVEHPTPWTLEHAVLQAISLPLNLQANQHHSFHSALTEIRKKTKAEAARLPVVSGRETPDIETW